MKLPMIILMLLLGAAVSYCLFFQEMPHFFESPETFMSMEYLSVPEDVQIIPITRDPTFKCGETYWGTSTPNNGSPPIYMSDYWTTHSRDTEGRFVYSSIIQGCKPYHWGCGNYAFNPVPAIEKLYLTVSMAKWVSGVYRKEGFAGALVDLWFENFKGDALVIDLYVIRDSLGESGLPKEVSEGFIYSFTVNNEFGKTYHFNYVLTKAEDGEVVTLRRLSLEPIVEMVFRTFRLNRSEWWLVTVDAGAEAHYSEITVYIYELEVGKIVD